MSKLVAMLFAAAGASTVSVGGVFMLKKTGGNGTSEGQKGSNQSETKLSADLGFTDLDSFKSSKGGDCTKKLFQEVDFNSKGTQIDSSANKIENTYFSSEANGTVQSCLVINWDRTDSSGSDQTKGKGEFGGLGAFVKGKKGMVVFTTTKAPKTTDKVNLEGGVYFLEEEASSNKGQVKKHKELTSSAQKEVDAGSIDEWFPKKDDSIGDLITSEEQTSKTYWWFVKDTADVKKLCQSTDTNGCPTAPAPKTKSFKASGIWSPDDNQSKKVSEGSSNVTTAISKIYGENELALTTAFDSFKGTGKNENLTKPEETGK